MDAQDMSPALVVRQRKFYTAVQSSGSEEGGIEGVGPIGGHEHLDISTRIKAVELIDKLQHRPLDLIIAPGPIVKACASDGIDLVKEDDTRLLRASHLKQLADHARSLADVLLNKLGSDDADEGRICAVRTRSGTQRFACPRRTVEQNPFRWVNSKANKALGLRERVN